MASVARLLKRHAAECLSAAAALAGTPVQLAVVADGRVVAAVPGVSDPPAEDSVSAPLLLDGAARGEVRVAAERGAALDPARQKVLAEALAALLQAVVGAEYARRAVAAETLEAYRELALVHRAAVELNRSLEPRQVASVLLSEFCGRKGAEGRAGAVFLQDGDKCVVERVACIGAGAEVVFGDCNDLVTRIFEGRTRGIVNDVPAPAAESGFRSMLALPLKAKESVLGVLVLLDRREFPAADLKQAETLASVAATALHNAQLFADQKDLFRALVDTIAHAIDAKSAYTSGHCRRVPVIARMLAEAACEAADGPFADFRLDDKGWEALELAAALHDCGKLVTPEWVMDKSAKLQTIHDRIAEVAARIAVLKREAEAACWRAIAAGTPQAEAEAALAEEHKELLDELAFLRECNTGGEFMTPERIERVKAIASREWRDADGEARPLLTDDEVENLCIPRGTLLPSERKVIEDHVAVTERMLSRLPFKGPLRAVPAIAGSHHERIDGKGYPKGLTNEQLSVEARILAIADVFEALTAPDRPYRRGATVSKAVAVMSRMAAEGHIDADLLRLMLDRNIHTTYARQHVRPEQVDLP